MKRLPVILICMLFALTSFAQEDWQEQLLMDAVTIVGDKMVLEEYGIVNGVDESGNEFSLQVKMYSEAPASGVIIRDNFVGFSMFVYIPIVVVFGDYEVIDEPIGNVDVEVNIYMSKNGIQIEFKNNLDGTTGRETMTWKSLYSDCVKSPKTPPRSRGGNKMGGQLSNFTTF